MLGLNFADMMGENITGQGNRGANFLSSSILTCWSNSKMIYVMVWGGQRWGRRGQRSWSRWPLGLLNHYQDLNFSSGKIARWDFDLTSILTVPLGGPLCWEGMVDAETLTRHLLQETSVETLIREVAVEELRHISVWKCHARLDVKCKKKKKTKVIPRLASWTTGKMEAPCLQEGRQSTRGEGGRTEVLCWTWALRGNMEQWDLAWPIIS